MHDTILLVPCAFGLRRRDDSEIPCKTRFSWVRHGVYRRSIGLCSLRCRHVTWRRRVPVAFSLCQDSQVYLWKCGILHVQFLPTFLSRTYSLEYSTQPREALSFEFQINFAAFSDVVFPLVFFFRIHHICLGHWNASELPILEWYEYKTIIFVWDILVPQSQKLLYKAEMAFQTASATKKWMSTQVIV